ncbi:MAG TPA: universal stress protein, partial [Geminicoccaceae bacterium]|nr:universal stress protein [Geminicoccaceae bacterium]
AVAAAMPILAAADHITLLSAETGAAVELGPEDLQAYLASHERAAAVRTFRSRPTEVAQGLLAAAKDAGSDVLLIGAYGHSRRRELVMGGVTQHIIEHTDLPVLMIH